MTAITASPPGSTQRLNLILTVAVQAGEVLLSSGQATSGVEETITALLAACGVPESQNLVTPTGIHVSIAHPELDVPLATLRRVHSRSLNLQRIARVNDVVRQVSAGEITLPAAQADLSHIARSRDRYPFWLLTLANALVSSSATALLGGSLLDAAVTFGSTILVFLLLQILERRRLPVTLGYVVGAELATAIAASAAWAGWPVHSTLVIAGGILILAPGAALLASVQDGISGDLLSSGARGLEAFLKGAAIASGIGVALSIAAATGLVAPVAQSSGALWPIGAQAIAAGVSTGAYAITVQAPRRSVPIAAGSGALCWLVGLGMAHLHGGGMFVAFVAALAAGLLGWGLGRWQRLPATVYLLPAIVPFLPGLSICNGMVFLTQNQTVPGLLVLVQAIFTGGALAAGVALSDAITPKVWRRGR